MELSLDNKGRGKVAFLGIAEKAAPAQGLFLGDFRWNVLGLKNIIPSYVYPLGLGGIYIGLAFEGAALQGSHKLGFFDAEDVLLGELEIGMNDGDIDEIAPSGEGLKHSASDPMSLKLDFGFAPLFLKIPDSSILVLKPGMVFVKLRTEEGDTIIGQVFFQAADPAPLSSDRIEALRSTPDVAKFIRYVISCKKCGDDLVAFCALSRPATPEKGTIWYEDLPDLFTCKCKETNMELGYIKRNLHAYLGVNYGGAQHQLNFAPLYEIGVLQNLRRDFLKLINSDCKEEAIQLFIGGNPILFHQFPAIRFFRKPKILNQYVADFGIVTPQKELLLVEIEKSSTRLMKKDGGLAAELSHALDQVKSWFHVVDNHKISLLDQLGISRHEVSVVRGIVIAGRDGQYDTLHLARLKGDDLGRIRLLTYDDILHSIDALIVAMEKVC